MIPALNMELEIVRTVLQNDVNDIYVCTDLLKSTGVFYTMISISDSKIRKLITEKLNTDQIFYSNQDFIGSFVYQNQLNLVFRYMHEGLLSQLGSVYLESFAECKSVAMRFVSACAECSPNPDMGKLLLDDRNINLSREGEVGFNYFLDFANYKADVTPAEYIGLVASTAFKVLELNYKSKYDSPEEYPSDLRLFYFKIRTGGFYQAGAGTQGSPSLGQIIATLREMDDKPQEQRGILFWFNSKFFGAKRIMFKNSMTIFLTLLVIATIIYASVQIYHRNQAKKAYASNVSYAGVEYIGDVYLGSEE